MKKSLILLSGFLFLVSQVAVVGCAQKKTTEAPPKITRKQLQNKRVALAEVSGATDSRTQIEVALVNEIIEKGRFEIVDRVTVQNARTAFPTDSDWKGLGMKVGADYVMAIKIQEFRVTERSGYDKVEEEDSVLTEEYGESKPVVGTRYVKAKSYEGFVKLSALFYDVKEGAITYQGVGEARDTIDSRDGKLPSKLRHLEKLSAQAINDLFEKMP